MKQYVKLFEEYSLNETIYQTGLGGGEMYASRGDSSVKSKTLSILKTGKWEKTESGKWALADAKRLADMWNAKDQSQWLNWFKDYSKDKEGKLEAKNFLNETAITVAVLDIMSKRESAEWLDAGGARSQCFANSIKWAEENSGKAIGGICIEKKNFTWYAHESLVVHAFCEKDKKYYEVTFPTPGLTKEVVYWPLITFGKTSEMTLSKDIWSYALGIEEGVKEYIKKYI
jgi:hypothetical protein